MNERILEKEASSFRQKCGLNNTDPIRLKSLLQKLNVISVFAPLADNFSGMALKFTEEKSGVNRFMLVNAQQSLGKQHFTICHELYHLYIQPNFVKQICHTGLFNKHDKDKNEYFADVFASYLLLPTEGLLENIPNEELDKTKISIGTIVYLEQFYSCSRKALLYSLKRLGLINSDQYTQHAFNVKRSALIHGFSTTLYEPGNEGLVIGDYGKIAKSLYDKERISESHYYSLLSDLGIDITKMDDQQNGES